MQCGDWVRRPQTCPLKPMSNKRVLPFVPAELYPAEVQTIPDNKLA